MGRRVNSFTLIEIVLSMGLIAIIASLLVYKTSGLVSYYKAKKNEGEFFDELSLIHFLSVAHNVEIDVDIEIKNKTLTLSRTTDDPIGKRYFKNILQFSPVIGMEVEGHPVTELSVTLLANTTELPQALREVKLVCSSK